MFPLIMILVVLICAVPLCLAVGFFFLYSGWPVGVAAAIGLLLFLGTTLMIIRGLVLKNARNSATQPHPAPNSPIL